MYTTVPSIYATPVQLVNDVQALVPLLPAIRTGTQICKWRHCHTPGGSPCDCKDPITGKPLSIDPITGKPQKVEKDWKILEFRTDWRGAYNLLALLAVGSVLLLN